MTAHLRWLRRRPANVPESQLIAIFRKRGFAGFRVLGHKPVTETHVAVAS